MKCPVCNQQIPAQHILYSNHVGMDICVLFSGSGRLWFFRYGVLIHLIREHRYSPPSAFIHSVEMDKPIYVAFISGQKPTQEEAVGYDEDTSFPTADLLPALPGILDFMQKLQALQDQAVRIEQEQSNALRLLLTKA